MEEWLQRALRAAPSARPTTEQSMTEETEQSMTEAQEERFEKRAKQERRRRLERPWWQDIEAKAEKDIATATRWAQGRRTIELLESTRRAAWVTAVVVTVGLVATLLAWLVLRAKIAGFFELFADWP